MAKGQQEKDTPAEQLFIAPKKYLRKCDNTYYYRCYDYCIKFTNDIMESILQTNGGTIQSLSTISLLKEYTFLRGSI